ncbi:MAG: LysE family translocator [Actinobacteria bacterium]|nr:LysE family translocator [Actinomycetota bacterium]MSW14919.1 LysE family translocator [Actinomycetota bacterium]MSW98258.1 LysE family translocator [Actinomycetota bacterium]MSY81819.1 LysE family translocator [Actinomycetota bacterium]MSZ45260.1 LysE family translocator [Actinomycetota bacterium]
MFGVIAVPSRIWEYVAAAMVIILAPGPSVLFVVARAIAWGRATAVATVAGNVLGAFTLSVVVAVGLGPLLQRSHLFYITVQILGGLYLMYMGIDAIRHSSIHAEDMTNQGDIRPSRWRSMRDGFWVGSLNPKGLVFFAAILPAFADEKKGHLTSQLILMGAIFALLAFFSDGAWGVLAGTIRNWLATDIKRLVRMRIAGGCVMILLGLFTIYSALLNR